MSITAPPRPAATRLAPNWFAAVMGTGIVASAAATLPLAGPMVTGGPGALLAGLATVVWALAVVLLVVVTAASVGGGDWRDHAGLSHFLGARAMAPMSVASATLLVGHRVLGEPAAYGLALALWVVGTGLGLATATSARIRAHRRGPAEAAWLMPVVPPMVSAAVGALLAVRSPEPLATGLLVASWACFATTLALGARPAAAVVRRVLGGDVPAAVPTLFIVLGPLGQSATAALLLAPGRTLAVVYAAVVVVAALAWLGLSAVLVARRRPAFAMTWWAFTFPVGTVVTGLSGLAHATGSSVAAVLAVTTYAGLVAAWVVVGARTLRGLRALVG